MRPKKPNQRIQRRKERLNGEIQASQVRLGEPVDGLSGVVATTVAIDKAKELDLDLVEITANADPPVCKIIDYGKFLYQQDKKRKEQKKNQKVMHLKEIKMRPKTDVHDYQFKVKHVREFLAAGDRVKITVKFRGREMAFQQSGKAQLDKVVADTLDIGKVESFPKMEGRQMIMVLVPKA